MLDERSRLLLSDKRVIHLSQGGPWLRRLAPRAMDGRDGGDPTRPGRERRSAAGGVRVDDEAAVGDGLSRDGLLEQAIEQQAALP